MTNTYAPENTVMRLLEKRTINMGNSLSSVAMTISNKGKAISVLDFDALYRAQFNNLYGYVISLTQNQQAAEDVTAEAFEKAYRKQRSFNPRKGTMEVWLFRIARNTALDYLRKTKNNPRRRLVEEIMPDPDDGNSPEAALENQVRKATITKLLDKMSGRDRELLSLKFFAELSNQEIAKILKISESNVGTLLYRALEKMREKYHENI